MDPDVVLHHNRGAYFREMISFGMPVDEARKIERLWTGMYGSAMRISPSASTKEAGKTIRNIHLEEPDFIVDAVSDLVARIRRDRRAAFPVDGGDSARPVRRSREQGRPPALRIEEGNRTIMDIGRENGKEGRAVSLAALLLLAALYVPWASCLWGGTCISARPTPAFT